MVEFDSLPPKSRSLILATLGLEIASANCSSIFELARKRFQTVPDVWRDVCKKTGQPRCTMPARVMGVDYAASASSPEAKAAPAPAAAATNTSPAGATANVSMFVDAAAATKNASPAVAAAPVSAAPSKIAHQGAAAAPAAAARRAQPQKKRTVAVAIGIAAVLLLGIGIAVFAIPRSAENPNAPPPTAVTRANNEPTRTAGEKPTFDPNSVAPPEGTVRRLDAIKGSFSKQK